MFYIFWLVCSCVLYSVPSNQLSKLRRIINTSYNWLSSNQTISCFTWKCRIDKTFLKRDHINICSSAC